MFEVINTKPIVAYKGLDMDFTCKGFKYEVGKEYHRDGEVKLCENGFHACADLCDVFNYYPMTRSRFAIVEMWGDIVGSDEDSKLCASDIRIVKEMYLPDIVMEYMSSKEVTENRATDCDVINLTNPTRKNYIIGDANEVFSSNYPKTIILKGDGNDFKSTQCGDMVMSCGDGCSIGSVGDGIRVISVGDGNTLSAINSVTMMSFGDGNRITIHGKGCGDTVFSDGDNCSISIRTNCSSCVSRGDNVKIFSESDNDIKAIGDNNVIYSFGNDGKIESYGNNASIVIDGDNVRFKAKKGSTITIVGHGCHSIDDIEIKEDTWYVVEDGKVSKE